MSSDAIGPSSPTLDLLRLPGFGRLLQWRHARSALQIPLLLLAGLMIFDGLSGPQLAPKNLATVLTWVHYRGLVILSLLLAGNLFCMACPFMLVRNAARRFLHPVRMWPARLRHKWLAVTLFGLMLFAYELFDLWSTPLWTAWLVVAYFAGALLVDSLFRGATFCKYLCPLGHFNFLSSLVSPLEVKVRQAEQCNACRTKDCIKGSKTQEGRAVQGARGCELWLFQPRKVGNVDCTFCLDCARVCPHDNVGLQPRLPASELWLDARRSGVGRLSRRPDLAVLAVLFCFGALINAFAMVRPVYGVEEWLASTLGTKSEALVLAVLFFCGLALVPAVLVGLTGWFSWPWARRSGEDRFRTWVTRMSFALVPLGFGVWLAHYSFHFLTGFWTFVPVMQSFVSDMAGAAVLGSPRWQLGPLIPETLLYPVELGFLGLGWVGSLLVIFELARKGDEHRKPAGAGPWAAAQWAILPWAALATLLLAAAVWLMGQPMEMRGTFLMG